MIGVVVIIEGDVKKKLGTCHFLVKLQVLEAKPVRTYQQYESWDVFPFIVSTPLSHIKGSGLESNLVVVIKLSLVAR